MPDTCLIPTAFPPCASKFDLGRWFDLLIETSIEEKGVISQGTAKHHAHMQTIPLSQYDHQRSEVTILRILIELGR